MSHTLDYYAKMAIKAQRDALTDEADRKHLPDFNAEKRADRRQAALLVGIASAISGLAGFAAGRITSPSSAEAALTAFTQNDAAVSALADRMTKQGDPTTPEQAKAFVSVLLDNLKAAEKPTGRSR